MQNLVLRKATHEDMDDILRLQIPVFKGEQGIPRAGLYFLRAIRICRHAKKHLHSKIITPASAFDFSPLAD